MTHLLRASTVVSWPLRHALAVLLLAGTAFAGNATATTYRIVELPLPPTATNPTVVGINATGDVVGYVDSSTTKEFATVWSAPDYAMRVLPQEDAYRTKAVAISDAGDIIGSASFRGDPSRPVMWRSNGTLVRLTETMPRGNGSSPATADINARGTVVGSLMVADQEWPAIWMMPQRLRVLKVASNPGSGIGSQATAINDSGTVVGYGRVVGDNVVHAFRRIPDGGMQYLGQLPGGSGNSLAYDVNEAGQIVGNSDGRAVMWNPDGPMLELGSLPGDDGHYSYTAYDINNLGEAIGRTSGSEVVHFLWTVGTGMLRIADMIDPLDPWYPQLQSGGAEIYVYDLNDAGVIVGTLYADGPGAIPIMLVPQQCGLERVPDRVKVGSAQKYVRLPPPCR